MGMSSTPRGIFIPRLTIPLGVCIMDSEHHTQRGIEKGCPDDHSGARHHRIGRSAAPAGLAQSPSRAGCSHSRRVRDGAHARVLQRSPRSAARAPRGDHVPRRRRRRAGVPLGPAGSPGRGDPAPRRPVQRAHPGRGDHRLAGRRPPRQPGCAEMGPRTPGAAGRRVDRGPQRARESRRAGRAMGGVRDRRGVDVRGNQ